MVQEETPVNMLDQLLLDSRAGKGIVGNVTYYPVGMLAAKQKNS